MDKKVKVKKKLDPVKTFKITAIIILIIILASAVGFGAYWIDKNWDNLLKGLKGTYLFTQEDIDNAYQSGLADAMAQKELYEEQISNFKKSYEQVLKDMSEVESQIKALQEKYNNLEKTSDSEKQNLQEKIIELNNKISEYESTIEGLNTQIKELEFEKQRLEAIIKAYEDQEKIAVTFRLGDDVFDTVLVKPGENVQPTKIPETNEKQKFLGWMKQGTDEVVDLNNITILEPTTFVAKMEYAHTVDFNLNYDQAPTIATVYVFNGEKIQFDDSTYIKRDGQVFEGWYNEQELVDLNDLTVTCNLILTAHWRQAVLVTSDAQSATIANSMSMHKGTSTKTQKFNNYENIKSITFDVNYTIACSNASDPTDGQNFTITLDEQNGFTYTQTINGFKAISNSCNHTVTIKYSYDTNTGILTTVITYEECTHAVSGGNSAYLYNRLTAINITNFITKYMG